MKSAPLVLSLSMLGLSACSESSMFTPVGPEEVRARGLDAFETPVPQLHTETMTLAVGQAPALPWRA